MAVARNPFHYGTPAEGEHFAGREAELAALLSRLRAGINVVVVSPRGLVSHCTSVVTG